MRSSGFVPVTHEINRSRIRPPTPPPRGSPTPPMLMPRRYSILSLSRPSLMRPANARTIPPASAQLHCWRMDLGLKDKVAIVTGSSRGLGLASARALVAEGCRVCLCARGSERLAEAALEIEAAARRPNMVTAVQADVSVGAGVDR